MAAVLCLMRRCKASAKSGRGLGLERLEDRQLLTVFAPDTRTLAVDTESFPNSAIASLAMRWQDGSVSFCSGSLIDSYHVLTAGHCTYNAKNGLNATSIWVSPGQQGDRLSNTMSQGRSPFQPFGQALATVVHRYDAWVQDADFDYDIALLALDRHLGNFTGALKFGYNTDDDWYVNHTAYSAGYPIQLNNDPNTAVAPDRFNMWGVSGLMNDETTHQLRTDTMDFTKGQSGSPIYYFNDQGARVVHAVFSHYNSSYNAHTRVTPQVFDDIVNWIAWDDANAQPTDRPDLVDSDAWFATGFDFVSDNSVQGGQALTVQTIVRNNGTAPSGPFSVEFRLSNNQTNVNGQDRQLFDSSDAVLGVVNVPSIAPFQSASVQWNGYIPLNVPIGNYSIVWAIDSTNAVLEYNEENNVADNALAPLKEPNADTPRNLKLTLLGGIMDDHGNSALTATPIVVPAVAPGVFGEIQYTNDIDYFAIPATAGAHYRLRTLLPPATVPLPLNDPTLTLYDTNGTTQLAFNDDISALDAMSQIVWTAPADGTYFVRVAGKSALGRYYLNVDVVDDHGDNALQATEIGVPSTTSGVRELVNDVDWFEFDAHQGGVYTLETSLGSLSNTTLTLYDFLGGQIAFNDDIASCNPLCNFASRIVWTAPESGPYSLQVSAPGSQTGSYALHVSVDDDHGDSKPAATPLIFTLGFNYAILPAGAVGNLESSGDVDWFRFDATAATTYTLETTLNGLSDSTLTLFATNGATQLAFNDDVTAADKRSKLVWTAPNNSPYFVQVAAPAAQTGKYALLITPDDDHASEFAQTDALSDGAAVDGNLVLPEDTDWFKIHAIAGAKLTLETELTGLADSTLSLYDDDQRTLLAFNDDAEGMGSASRIVWTAGRGGDFYVAVGGHPGRAGGNYVIRARLDDTSDEYTTARGLGTPAFWPGRLETAGDVDVFSFPAMAGEVYDLRTYLSDLPDSTLTLLDVDGVRELAFNDDAEPGDAGSGSQLRWAAPRDGVYFLRVGSPMGRDFGAYSLVVTHPDDHGGDASRATRLATDSVTPGVIEMPGDVDWFSVSVVAGQSYTLAVEPGSLPLATLVLYDRDGQAVLRREDNDVQVRPELRWIAPATATYFLAVSGTESESLGDYTVTVARGVANPPPRVVCFGVGSTQWTPEFREYDSFGQSRHTGYVLPVGSTTQLTPLPWTNLNQFALTFSEPVIVERDSLILRDAAGLDYTQYLTGFTYDVATQTAIWTSTAALRAGQFIVTLDDAVTDGQGERLDGEWSDAVSVFPSGDGTTGGPFQLSFRVAPGDVNRDGRVDRADLIGNLGRQFTTLGTTPYNRFHDVDGDGYVRVVDLLLIQLSRQDFSASAFPASLTVAKPTRALTFSADRTKPPRLIALATDAALVHQDRNEHLPSDSRPLQARRSPKGARFGAKPTKSGSHNGEIEFAAQRHSLHQFARPDPRHQTRRGSRPSAG